MSFDQLFDGSDAHILPSNAADCAAKLRQYNRWRRGEDSWPDEDGPNLKELMLLIDYAADALEQKVCCGEFETCREMCVVRADVYKSQRHELLAALQSIVSLRPIGTQASEYALQAEGIAMKAIAMAKGGAA